MHGKDPPEVLHPWLPEEPSQFDMYAIGTQEAERSIELSILIPSKAKWEAKLGAALGHEFEMVGTCTLAAIHLIVFAKPSVLRQISNVKTASVATGIMNTLGNKGGVGISFQLGASSVLFVNSHFAAHQTAVAERNADFERINAQLPLRPKRRVTNGAGVGGGCCARFDVVVWLGDLNYRVDGNRAVVDSLLAPPDEKAKTAQHWKGSEAHSAAMRAVLIANDQLTRQRAAGAVFAGFTEGQINFRPTYKFDIAAEVDTYDTSEKQRIPAYTDRILYRSARSDAIQLLRYDSCAEIRTSDHKPVLAEMLLTFDPVADAPVWRRSSKASARGSTGVTSSVCAVM